VILSDRNIFNDTEHHAAKLLVYITLQFGIQELFSKQDYDFSLKFTFDMERWKCFMQCDTLMSVWFRLSLTALNCCTWLQNWTCTLWTNSTCWRPVFRSWTLHRCGFGRVQQ